MEYNITKLKNIVFEILVKYLNIKKSIEEKLIIKNMLEKIDDHNTLKNLALIVHLNIPKKQKVSFCEFLYLFLLIIKETNNSKYVNYKMSDLIEEFFEDPLLNSFIKDSNEFSKFKKLFLRMKI